MSSIVCSCGKLVPTQPEWAGQWITCPGCGGSLYAPFPGDKPAPPPAPVAAGTTRLCPFCAETIPVADAACRFCGSDPSAPRPARVPSAAPAPTAAATDDGGVQVLVLAIVGFMFCQLLCPIAWIMGASYEADCRRRGVEPSSNGHAGKIVGIIGTCLAAVSLVFFVLAVILECL